MMSGTMFVGNGVSVFRLVVLKNAVKGEAQGMKMSRGPKNQWTKAAKAEFGLPKATPEQLVEAIEAAIEAARGTLAEGDITAF